MVWSWCASRGAKRARFSTHTAAESAVKALGRAKKPVCLFYNERPYDDRGWCVFEQGVATMADAHVKVAERQALEKGRELPERFRLAQAARPKVTDISNGMSVVQVMTESPEELLSTIGVRIDKSKFTGAADKPTVKQMAQEFEWDIYCAVRSAQVDALKMALAPGQRKQGLQRLSRQMTVRLRAPAKPQPQETELHMITARGSEEAVVEAAAAQCGREAHQPA